MKWFVTLLLDWLLASVWPRIKEAITTWLAKLKRGKEQKKAEEKVKEDIEQEKPRDEETRKHEEDWLNS